MNTSSQPQYERKRCIIGVIGGDNSRDAAAARIVGEEITVADQIILTGGEPKNDNNIKNATLWGADQAGINAPADRPLKARMIGILKRGKPKWEPRNPCRFILETGLSSFERDPINGLTPDAMIVFEGGRGTLCELAYAAAARKPILFFDSLAALREKAEEHISDGVLLAVLKEAVGKYPSVLGKRVSPSDLLTSLAAVLESGMPGPAEPRKIVRFSIAVAFEKGTPLGRTGFPGLNGDTEHFEKAVQRMESCI